MKCYLMNQNKNKDTIKYPLYLKSLLKKFISSQLIFSFSGFIQYWSLNDTINEWLASAICERLGFEHCHYDIDIIDNKIVSKCINFIKDDEEIITAIDVYKSKKKENHISDFEHYIIC